MEQITNIKPEEFKSLIGLIDDVFRRSSNLPPTMLQEYPVFFAPENYQNLMVMKEGERIISHIGIYPYVYYGSGQKFKLAGIGAVLTRPEFRKQGYFDRLMRYCIEKMKREGDDAAILWGAIGLYGRFGFQPGGRGYNYTVLKKKMSVIKPAPEYKILPYRPEYLDALIKLHDQKEFRVVKNKEQWKKLLRMPTRAAFMAVRNDQLVAYAITGDGMSKERIVDFAGEKEILPEFFSYSLNTLNSEQVKFSIPFEIKNMEKFGVDEGGGACGLVLPLKLEARDPGIFIWRIDYV